MTAYCVPDTALRALPVQIHLCSQQLDEVEIMVNPTLQKGKSRHKRFGSLPKVLKWVRGRAGI